MIEMEEHRGVPEAAADKVGRGIAGIVKEVRLRLITLMVSRSTSLQPAVTAILTRALKLALIQILTQRQAGSGTSFRSYSQELVNLRRCLRANSPLNTAAATMDPTLARLLAPKETER